MQQVEPERPTGPREPTTTELVRDAISDVRELVRLEVRLATDELKRELLQARAGGIALSVAAILAIEAIALLLLAVSLAIYPGAVPAVILGLALLVGALVLAFAGYKLLPRKPLATTRKRLETDIGSVKERI